MKIPGSHLYHQSYLAWCKKDNARRSKENNRKRKNEEAEGMTNSSDDDSDDDLALQFQPRKKVRIKGEENDVNDMREVQTIANTENKSKFCLIRK